MKYQRTLLAIPASIFVSSLGWDIQRQIRASIASSATNWRRNPKRSAVDLAVSFAYGQGVMWTIGQDYIGVGMNPIWRPGIGHKIAARVAARLPHTPLIFWGVKILEILSDASKIPLEGKLAREIGIVPDAVAQLVTQPLWSYIETVEKTLGVVLHPDRVCTSSQLEDSISNVYGTWTRNLASLILLRYGSSWRDSVLSYSTRRHMRSRSIS